MTPAPTDVYVPVVDISQHQGSVDFRLMRDRGVDGLIIRSNHATTVDARCADYVLDARRAGWRDDQVGFYTFCNPKRATGAASAKAFVDTVVSIFGHTRTVLMLDVEGYESESGGGPVIKGAAFAAWIREHIDTVRRLAPHATLIAYSNAAFWNPWVGDPQLASELEWIVPRYPVYSANGYQLHPLPSTPAGWPGWAFARTAAGPFPPAGAHWDGWQFSAGYNSQGLRYGCQSSDLDLNIVERSAWRRWTRTETPAPIPVPVPVPGPVVDEEDAMKIKTPNQWFEKVGVDLRAIANGVEFGGLPGLEVSLTTDEMGQLLATCRHTYGNAKPEMGATFVAAWDAKREQPSQPAGSGGGEQQTVLVKVDVSGP